MPLWDLSFKIRLLGGFPRWFIALSFDGLIWSTFLLSIAQMGNCRSPEKQSPNLNKQKAERTITKDDLEAKTTGQSHSDTGLNFLLDCWTMTKKTSRPGILDMASALSQEQTGTRPLIKGLRKSTPLERLGY